jgi:hypothetical protein
VGADFKAIDRNWDDLKQLRSAREGEWQSIADYFMPRKGFTVTARPTELMRRRVTSSLGPRILGRGAALLVAYLVDASRPFIGPNVDLGMVQAGRSLNLDAEGTDFLDTLQWAMFDRMMSPQSGFLSSISRLAIELEGFGTGIQWIGRKRGFGPIYQARPLRSCWIADNEDGEVDTNYFRYTIPAWKVLEKYPEADKVQKLRELGSDEKTYRQDVTLLHVVEPRKGGRAGAVATAKPFQACVVAPDFKAILDESGYDTFPYSVARLGVEEGSAYGTGMAWQALPDVAAHNWFRQKMEQAAGLRVDPPLAMPARLFGKPLDRRAGAVNTYNAAGLGFQNLRDAIQRFEIAGDPNAAAQIMDGIKRDAEEIFFVDWMSLNDGVQKTAEEIRDRRDLRVRAMSALVPSVDRDLLGKGADRTLQIMLAEGQLPPPPASLAGIDVDWDYKGPLAMMQQRGQFEGVDRLFDLTTKAIGIDENAKHALMVSEGLRAAAEALGVPVGVMRSRQDYDAAIEAQNTQAQDAADMEHVQGAATSLRDAGQGISSMMGAGPGGGAGGRPPLDQAA